MQATLFLLGLDGESTFERVAEQRLCVVLETEWRIDGFEFDLGKVKSLKEWMSLYLLSSEMRPDSCCWVDVEKSCDQRRCLWRKGFGQSHLFIDFIRCLLLLFRFCNPFCETTKDREEREKKRKLTRPIRNSKRMMPRSHQSADFEYILVERSSGAENQAPERRDQQKGRN